MVNTQSIHNPVLQNLHDLGEVALSRSSNLIKVGRDLVRKFSEAPIYLIPAEQTPTVDGLRGQFPDASRIFAVDFYVQGAERGRELPGESGHLLHRQIYNIDHHSSDVRWERHISSGNLACRWVRSQGVVGQSGDVVVINHADCDSIIASLILVGALPPDIIFEEAVVDADHRGRANPISDILQSTANTRDLVGSVAALSRELQGLPPNGGCRDALEELQRKRLEARELVKTGTIYKDGVVLIRAPKFIDSDLFLTQLPDAVAIVISCPSSKFPDMEVTRIRLGGAAPEGLSLHRLGITTLDPYFGGRYDAGSNKRGLDRARLDGRIPVVVPSIEHFNSLVRNLGHL